MSHNPASSFYTQNKFNQYYNNRRESGGVGNNNEWHLYQQQKGLILHICNK